MTDEQRAKRIHYHMYETCEGIAEHAERIVRLEDENAKLRELVIRMRPICMQGKRCTFADRIYICKTMEELGIEVEDD